MEDKKIGSKINKPVSGIVPKGKQINTNSTGTRITKKKPTNNNILANNNLSRIKHHRLSMNSLLGGSTIENENSTDVIDDSIYEDGINDIGDIKGDGTVEGLFKRLPIKVKLILLGIGISVCSIIIFLIILITPLMELGIIDIESTGGNLSGGSGGTVSPPTNNYTPITGSTSYWWPVGGNTSNIGGVTFASEPPSKITITSKFGMRKHPITGKMKKHSGVDIVGGSNIIAVTDGEVIYPSNSDKMNCPTSNSLDDCGGGYGNYVMIRHGDGNVTLYAHLYENSITVRSGDLVKQGQVIAKMGSSGNSTGTHLHFEVRVNNTRVEPLNYINANNPRP